MKTHVFAVLYVLAMILVIVGVDFLFLRNQLWLRLAVNVSIAVVFAAVYFLFFRNP